MIGRGVRGVNASAHEVITESRSVRTAIAESSAPTEIAGISSTLYDLAPGKSSVCASPLRPK